MNQDNILQKLEQIENYMLVFKEFLTVDELAIYIGLKKSYIYKLVMANKIPFSKPNGKMLFFDRKKIDDWLFSASENNDLEDINS